VCEQRNGCDRFKYSISSGKGACLFLHGAGLSPSDYFASLVRRVHGIGLLIFFTLVWPYDAQRRLVWETGTNTGFWLAAAQAIIFTVLALLAFIRLTRVTKHTQAARDKTINPK
jgi:hypothetical protein